ncbi:MAG: DsrE family protein [Chloroflexi bacterium]|nr:DsrE family protein [Chloroflexota bacterium]
MPEAKPTRLLLLWTTDNKETAANMVLMYTTNSCLHGWWDEVVLLLWGAAQRLAAEDADIQALLAAAKNAGVRPIACLACARNMGTLEALQAMGVEVFYTGQFLSDWLKSGDQVLSV